MSQIRQDTFEVVIIGCGTVGLQQAILLKEAGISVAIYERQAKAYSLPRAATLDHETLRLFHSSVASGVGQKIEPLLDPGVLNDFVWRDANLEPLASISWARIGCTGYPITRPFNQPAMEAALAEVCRNLEIPIHREVELYELTQDDDSVHMLFSKFDSQNRSAERTPCVEVTAQYVVGCDGANSKVRRICGLTEHTLPFSYDFLIADLLPDLPEPEQTIKYVPSQICDPARPLTIVFGGPGRRRFEFLRLPHEDKEEMAADDNVFALIKKWGYDRSNCRIERAVIYTFAAKWANEWTDRRVFLAGDSAHQTPPFIGQGLNSGMRDANNLAWRIAAVLRKGASPKIFDSYTSERLPHVQHLTNIAVDGGRVICETDPEQAKVIQAELKRTGIRADVPLAGPGIFYDKKPLVGSLGTQAVIRHQGREDLTDQIVGRRAWTLLTIDGPQDPLELLDASERDLWKHLDGVALQVGSKEVDISSVYSAWFRDTLQAKAVIIRPDFYVYGYTTDLAEVSMMVQKLKEQLGL